MGKGWISKLRGQGSTKGEVGKEQGFHGTKVNLR